MKDSTDRSQSLLHFATTWLWSAAGSRRKTWSAGLAVLALATVAHAAIGTSRTAVGSATNFPTNSISGANGTRTFSTIGTASGATIATGLGETRWTTNGVAWGEVFKWTGSTGTTLSGIATIVNSISSGSYQPFLFDLGAVTFNTTSSTFNPSAQTNRLSVVTITPAAISAQTFLEFDFSGSDAISLTNGHSYAFGLLNLSTGNIVILRSNGVTSDPNGAPFQISSGGLSGTSATVPGYGAGVRNLFIGVYTTTGGTTPPSAPTGLTATAGDSQVALSWNTSSGATVYNVKRATTNGGPYTLVTSVASPSYTNTGLTNGTTYYFVVSAQNSGGESANSAQASATPTAGSGAPPLVYSSENTGASYAPPPLPTLGNCLSIPPLPDPFAWGNDPTNQNGTRSTAFSDWEHHRNEAAAYLQNYEIGTKPAVNISSQVTASYASNTLTVHVTANGQTLTLTCAVSIPSGATAPYPVCIGMNSPYGSLTASDFTSRGIVSVVYSHNQVTTYNNPQSTDPYYRLYPSLWGNSGQYSAWAWGVSRIIDGLTLVKNSGALNVDLNHIGVTGCSYAGKMALFSGAFDERVALTVAQESGGGGDTSWRYSATEPSGTVEGIPQTSHQWFSPSLFQFGSGNEQYLPDDHHMLMAMCAPRALYCTANTNYTWLSNPSAYVCGQACAKVYNTLGIADRFGFNVDGGHTHCAFPSDQESELQYFLNKFMKGQTSLSQTIRTAPSSYSSINYARWTQWWGTSNPVLPP